jgi:hypothetical protein
LNGSGGTAFAPPLSMLSDLIKEENIKELLMVFLTDGENCDHEETKDACR